MSASTLPLSIDVSGMTGSWLWTRPRGVLPVGVLLDHGDHMMMVTWSAYAGVAPEYVMTLDSLLPLTVIEPVRCETCGMQGRIEQGAWLPDEDGGGS